MEKRNLFVSGKAVVAAVCGAFTAAFGWLGWLVVAWAACKALDWVRGSAAAASRGAWSSAAARAGIWHKAGMVVVVLVCALTDAVLAVAVANLPGLGFEVNGVVLPVVLDAGTNRQSLIDDPLYLGLHHERISDGRYDAFVDAFLQTAEKLFPHLYVHFEDFGRENAARLLERYEDRYAVYNDDIEGTGAVTLAAILGGLKASGEKLTDQTFLCFGAGTSGMGIVRQVFEEMKLQGLSDEEARSRFYLVDQQGLLFEDTEGMTPQQKPYARKRSEFPAGASLDNLEDVVKAIHPTILVGASTAAGAITREIVQEMAAHTPRPIIFPLSNPADLAEASADDLLHWTDGKALVATGTASRKVVYHGTIFEIGQANNSLVFPGMGLAVAACRARKVSRPAARSSRAFRSASSVRP